MDARTEAVTHTHKFENTVAKLKTNSCNRVSFKNIKHFENKFNALLFIGILVQSVWIICLKHSILKLNWEINDTEENAKHLDEAKMLREMKKQRPRAVFEMKLREHSTFSKNFVCIQNIQRNPFRTDESDDVRCVNHFIN